MRINWLVLALYAVGVVVVTLAEGTDRAAALRVHVPPATVTREPPMKAPPETVRRVDVVASAIDVSIGRVQLGNRNDDPDPSLAPTVGVPGGGGRQLRQ